MQRKGQISSSERRAKASETTLASRIDSGKIVCL